METSGPLPGSPPVSAPRPDATTSAWQVGQILRAITLSSSPDGQTQLRIGNQVVQGQSPIPLPAGQPVSLQVESLAPQPLLRILMAPGADPVGDAIRTILPRQGALAPLLSNLAQLGNARPAVLPPLVQELSRTLLRQLPDTRAVGTASGLRQAVAQSGLFLEARLLAARDSGRVNLGVDLKANLMRLVQLVRNWPGVQSDTGAGTRPATPAASAPTPLPATPAGSAATPATPAPGPAPTAMPSPLQGLAVPTPATPASAPGLPPVPPGMTVPAGQPPSQAGNPAQGNTATPATLARGMRAATPLPAAAGQGTPTVPVAPTTTPASALSRVLLMASTGFPPYPPPPLRGQPPQPQARAQASLQAQMPTSLLRSELLQQTEASVARLQLSQLASLPQGRDTGQEWLFDLPVRRGEETDVWSLSIRHDDPSGSRSQEVQGPLWTVQLAFDLPGLGPMQARVSLRGEQVSTWFWATRDEALPLLQQHLQELRRELEASGLRVGELHCLRGRMPEAAGRSGPRPPIVDERA